jgi:hypothetical protein
VELWRRGNLELALQQVEQPGVVDSLVRLLQEGDATKQATSLLRWMLSKLKYAASTTLPISLAPSRSEPSSWSAVSGLAAVLQSPAAPAEGKADAAYAMYYLMRAFMGDNPAWVTTPLLMPNSTQPSKPLLNPWWHCCSRRITMGNILG